MSSRQRGDATSSMVFFSCDMTSTVFLYLLSALLASTPCRSFSTVQVDLASSRPHQRRHHCCYNPISSTSLSLSPSSSSSPQFPQDWSHDGRINVRNLLTQRAIQSFLCLCESVRDPHSGKWIQDFLRCPNQLEFHGTGASYTTIDDERFGGTWDGPLLAMLDQPKDVIIVSAKRRGAGHGGWSKNNPHLPVRYVEFEIDIDPVSLANRILAVREQIAAEWHTDLNILAQANDQILASYFDMARAERSKLDEELVSSPSVAFERTAVNLMNNQTIFAIGAGASSPLRKGNFDLLYNLCTQASVHRLLGELKEDAKEWLREFYVDRVEEYFDGDQPYGRADDFLEDLLLSTPSVVRRNDGKLALADPFGLAEQIIETRNTIVAEWKDAMEQVPADHQDGIRRIILNKQMEAWGSGGSPLGGASFQ